MRRRRLRDRILRRHPDVDAWLDEVVRQATEGEVGSARAEGIRR